MLLIAEAKRRRDEVFFEVPKSRTISGKKREEEEGGRAKVMAWNVSHQISKEFKNVGTLFLDAYSEIKLLFKVYI